MTDLLTRSRDMFKSGGIPRSRIKVGRGGSIPVPESRESKPRYENEIEYTDTHLKKNIELEKRIKRDSGREGPEKRGFKLDENRAMAIIRKLPGRYRGTFLEKLKGARTADEARELFKDAQRVIEQNTVHPDRSGSIFD